LEINQQTVKPAEKVNLICLKWGSLYGPEYVNKILGGVQRHLKKPFNFYCMTENSSGLNEKIKIIPLLEDWKGWWGKATLFSKCTPLLFPSISFPQGSPPIQLRVLSSAECLH
jgi:hypothetical protein